MEDQKLQNLVMVGGVPTSPKEWVKIAENMNGRTPKQCRDRWKNHLAPDIRRDPWTPEEDERLLEAQARMGNTWSCFLQLFPGRTYVSLKNRYLSTLSCIGLLVHKIFVSWVFFADSLL